MIRSSDLHDRRQRRIIMGQFSIASGAAAVQASSAQLESGSHSWGSM
jgi:hypothetical protein